MNSRGPNLVRIILSLAVIIFIAGSFASANVRLPHIFSDNMVLQRDKELPIWGWADSGEKITIDFTGNTTEATTDENGFWQAKLAPLKAGGPFVMTIKGNNTIQIQNVLVGDVWLCSGQSNMEWPLVSTTDAAKEIADSNYPQIRLLSVPRKTSGMPKNDCDVAWNICGPETSYSFSAIGYFFGRKIYREINVPIGLINSSWGGSRIEPWTPPEGFTLTESTQKFSKYIQDTDLNYRKSLEKSLDSLQDWLTKTKKALADNKPLQPQPDIPKHPLDDYSQPTGIYNSMIYPLKPFAIAGALWYQGESNIDDGMLYMDKMKDLIGGWRKVWQEGDFPFYFVQLAPYIYGGDPDRLPIIWQAQTAAMTAIPNTGMVETIDLVDNINDIHPRNKKEVGERLALWALAKYYNRPVPAFCGPIYKSMKIEDSNKIRISFEYTGSGLMTRNNQPVTNFEIAGSDKKFVKADAAIENSTVLVWSRDVNKPAMVRFCWNEQAKSNLFNKEGLPASPFTTE